MTTNLKTSLLVNKQVPEFIREENPKFVAFLEAYYEFLENKQGTNKNDLTKVAKDLRYVSDVDYSLNQFEEQFFNTFASNFSRDIVISKEFLIKNVLPIYLSKGAESSFKLLFRMLFGENVEVTYPKDNILRASDGKWEIENILRVDNTVKSFYTGDGQTKEFNLAQIVNTTDIIVYFDDVRIATTNYYVLKEQKRIVFFTAPSNGVVVKVQYLDFNEELLLTRQLTGRTSGATCLIEKIIKRIFGEENSYELFVNTKTLERVFETGEYVDTTIIADDGSLIDIELETLSDLKSINVINAGSNYNIGDPVIVFGPATRSAVAVVSDVVSGKVTSVVLEHGGYGGYQVNNHFIALNVPETTFNARIVAVDSSVNKTINSVFITTNIIANVNSDISLASANYGFPAFANTNSNTIISQALSNVTLSNLGIITTFSVTTLENLFTPTFDVISPRVTANLFIEDFSIIGNVAIHSGGTNYVPGDIVVFTNPPHEYNGIGANGEVYSVAANGAITSIRLISGGFGYNTSNWPIVTVNSANGTGANISVVGILGTGESFDALTEDGEIGAIKAIKILDSGFGYDQEPFIDLTKSGDGLAIANSIVNESYLSKPGKWITTDSLLSSEDRKLEGKDYYMDFSYVLSSKVEFSRYKDLFKLLVHPAGFMNYSEYQIYRNFALPEINSNMLIVESVPTTNTISGTVNVNSSIYVVGTGTKFNLANNNGILVPGSNVAINTQVRTVNTIISNTMFTVTTPFTITSNNEDVIILI